MSTLIVIGATGELGSKTVQAACVSDASGWAGPIIGTYNSNPPPFSSPNVKWAKLDCGDHKAVRSLVASQMSLGAVLYCAVPPKANASSKASETLRCGIVEDVVNCAEAVVMVGARFVGVSSDNVFDGQLADGRMYTETSDTCPCSMYGKYKESMERRLMALSGYVIIARTSLILTIGEGKFGRGTQFIVDGINGKYGEIEFFTDELRNMSFSDDLGRAMVELGKKECSFKGIIHLASDEVTNRWEVAKKLSKRLGIEDNLGKWAKSGLSSKSGMNRALNCSLSTSVRKSSLNTHIDGVSDRLG